MIKKLFDKLLKKEAKKTVEKEVEVVVETPIVETTTPKNKIVAISTNKKNVIKQVQLDNGEILDVKKAITLVEQDLIEGVEVWSVRNGHKALRSIPDQNKNNNLKDLPRF